MLEGVASDDSRGELVQETETLCREIQELHAQERLVSPVYDSFAGISLS